MKGWRTKKRALAARDRLQFSDRVDAVAIKDGKQTTYALYLPMSTDAADSDVLVFPGGREISVDEFQKTHDMVFAFVAKEAQ